MSATWTARDEFHLQESLDMIALWTRLLNAANDPNARGPRDSAIARDEYRALINRENKIIAAMLARKASEMEAA